MNFSESSEDTPAPMKSVSGRRRFGLILLDQLSLYGYIDTVKRESLPLSDHRVDLVSRRFRMLGESQREVKSIYYFIAEPVIFEPCELVCRSAADEMRERLAGFDRRRICSETG